MFKSVPVGLVALTFLSEDVMASKATYRPTVEQAPWYKTASKSTWNTPDWPINYKVPNFGVDSDIKTTQKNIADSEKKLKSKFTASFDKPKPPPRDYFVPNLGKDRDLVLNDINLEQAEKQHNHKLQASFDKPKGHPVDYKVPNFGVDKDILATQEHMKKAEKQLKKKLVGDFFDDKSPKYPVDYKVPNFGLDTDIKNTVTSLKSTEKKLGNWNPVQDADGAWVVPTSVALQTEAELAMEDDPICSSAGCTQYKHPEAPAGHPTDYPVPSFGADPDIEATANSISIGEAMYNHKIVMGTDESKAQWKNPAKDVDYNFAPELDHDVKVSQANLSNAEATLGATMDVQIQSDPICSSAGCTQYEHPKVDTHPMDYFVPNFGVDQEVKDHNSALAYAEKQLKHKLVIEDKPEWPQNYKVANFGPDPDIVATKASISKAEEDLGSTWTPTQDANGYWIVPQPFDNKSYAYNNRDVFVQLDAESDPICSSAGCTQYEHPKLDTHPMDYPVPNFGVDHDVLASHNSIDVAEKQLNHKWKWEELKETDPIIYDDAKPLDVDIQHSLSSMEQQEGIHGAWTPTKDADGNWILPKAIDNRSYSYESDKDQANIQLADDPICSSAGCTQYKHPEAPAGHPMDYPVPSFGADPDVEATANSISIGEAMYKHKIVMGTDESKAQWKNPAKDVDYNFAPELDHDVKVSQTNLANAENSLGTTMLQTETSAQSDPICSSAGCTQYKWPEPPAGHPMNYPVPNFGVDTDIEANFQSLAAAEKIRKHKWNFEFLPTPINPAKKTLYNWDTPLEADMIHSAQSLKVAEEQLGQKMVIWDEVPQIVE